MCQPPQLSRLVHLCRAHDDGGHPPVGEAPGQRQLGQRAAQLVRDGLQLHGRFMWEGTGWQELCKLSANSWMDAYHLAYSVNLPGALMQGLPRLNRPVPQHTRPWRTSPSFSAHLVDGFNLPGVLVQHLVAQPLVPACALRDPLLSCRSIDTACEPPRMQGPTPPSRLRLCVQQKQTACAGPPSGEAAAGDEGRQEHGCSCSSAAGSISTGTSTSCLTQLARRYQRPRSPRAAGHARAPRGSRLAGTRSCAAPPALGPRGAGLASQAVHPALPCPRGHVAPRGIGAGENRTL